MEEATKFVYTNQRSPKFPTSGVKSILPPDADVYLSQEIYFLLSGRQKGGQGVPLILTMSE